MIQLQEVSDTQDSVKVSLIQFESTWLDREKNAGRMAKFVEEEATKFGADLLVFPELATTGYLEPHMNKEFAEAFYRASERIPGPTTELLGDVARRHKVHIITGISQLHPRIPHVLYNSAVLIGPDGEVVGIHNKIHAAFEEKNYFICGSNADVYQTALGAIGMHICYDVRFPELARVQALKGAEIIVSIWCASAKEGRVSSDSVVIRCRTRAYENALYFIGCNRSGRENDRVYYGRSAIADPRGELIASSETDQEEVVRGTLTDSELFEQRTYLTLFRDRRPELYAQVCDPL